MPIECIRSTSGGKGNYGMFTERDSNIVAAGLPSAQQDESVRDSLRHYLLQEKVDALVNDAVMPEPKPIKLPPLRTPIPKDTRHSGPFSEAASLLRPTCLTKFENLVEEFKETSYKSYWNMPIGRTRDPVPMLPEGFDVTGTTFGKPTPFHGRLYDIIMPKQPYPDKTPSYKNPGAQTSRKYCQPSYNPNSTFGSASFLDRGGVYVRCSLTDDRVLRGTSGKAVVSSIQADIQEAKQPRIGTASAPNKNIHEVPDKHTFGILKPLDNLPECLRSCEINEGVEFFRKCLTHLNTVRKCMSKRFTRTFFFKFSLTLKSYDTDKTGWLSKDIIYKQCGINLIRFDPKLIEPLLTMWHAFDGSRIKYVTFIRIFNYRERCPEIPKIPDFEPECLDFSTSSNDMAKPEKPIDKRQMAGIPSGRYFDADYPPYPEDGCAAGKTYLSQESDAKSCIYPSILSQTFVSHRDMFEKQEPSKVRKVFEAAGETFSNERFDAVWAEAQKLHSQGWVCYETFRQALAKNSNATKFNKKETDK